MFLPPSEREPCIELRSATERTCFKASRHSYFEVKITTMKKKTLKFLILSALVAGTFAFLPSADAAVQVNPIPNLPENFIKGADVSMLPELESLGAKFYDVDGTQMDELQIMKNHGINWIRLRSSLRRRRGRTTRKTSSSSTSMTTRSRSSRTSSRRAASRK